MQAAGQDDVFAKRTGFAREDYEDGPGNFLGGMRVARGTQGDAIDLVNVPRDEFGKRRRGPTLGKFAQQSIVIQFVHPYLMSPTGKR
jgi:hypothetical protein